MVMWIQYSGLREKGREGIEGDEGGSVGHYLPKNLRSLEKPRSDGGFE